jgi:hypothetical protein
MARGSSGRIVIDVDPEFKEELYHALALQGSTLKDWFVTKARHLCEESRQPAFSFAAEDPASFRSKEVER